MTDFIERLLRIEDNLFKYLEDFNISLTPIKGSDGFHFYINIFLEKNRLYKREFIEYCPDPIDYPEKYYYTCITSRGAISTVLYSMDELCLIVSKTVINKINEYRYF